MKNILTGIGTISIGLGIIILIAAVTGANLSLISVAIAIILSGVLFLTYAKVLELLAEISAATYFIRKHIESEIVDEIYEESEKSKSKNPAQKFSVRKND